MNWSTNFVFGRKIKTLTVVDDCSKEVVQIAGDSSIPVRYVTRLLDQAITRRGRPRSIGTDIGPKLARRVMQAWAVERANKHLFQPDMPTRNAYMEGSTAEIATNSCRSTALPV